MRKLLSQIVAGCVGLWIASTWVPGIAVTVLPDSSFFGINLTQQWQLFIVLGIIIGLLNFFVKPILNIITLPLRIITLGLFGIAIQMGLIWVVSLMFNEFTIALWLPLLYISSIIWVINFIISKFVLKDSEVASNE